MELVRNAPTVRHTLADGSWVELKSRLTFAERKQLASSAFTMVQSAGTLRPELSLAAAELAGLQLGIVAWSLSDPVTPENIALLDDEAGSEIKGVLDALWKQRSDDERKNSSAAGAPQSEGWGGSPPSSGG